MQVPALFQRRGPRSPRDVRRSAALCALSALALGSCARLEARPENVCGNLTLEPEAGEDCDGQEGCGEPGSEHACRFVCTPPEGECPEQEKGYGCGVDGVCRRASGQLAPMTEIVTSFARDLLTGDVNRDGCDEIFHTTLRGTAMTATASAAFGYCAAASEELPAGQPPPKEQSIPPAPMLADLSNDTRPDLLLPARGFYGDGLFVHLAEETPTLTPLLYPTVRVKEKTIRVLGVTRPVTDALYIFIQPDADDPKGPPGGKATVAALQDASSLAAPVNVMFPASLPEIAFLVAADLDEVVDEATGCDEVLLGVKGESKIHVYRTCGVGNALVLAESDGPGPMNELGIDLLNGTKIRDRNASISVLDVNGDEWLDVLVNSTGPDLQIAYGTGNGKLHSQPPAADTVPDGKTSVLVLPPTMENLKLYATLASPDNGFVAGDFDADVLGIELTAVPCPSTTEVTGSPGCEKQPAVCESVVADLDADGNLDAAFTLGADPSIIIGRGGKDDQAHLALLPTQCPPRGLTTGDFDGDGIGDVAFIDPVAVDGQSRASLSIAYGRAFADPEEPVTSGRIELGSSLAAGNFAQNAPGVQIFAGRDAPDDEDAPSAGPGAGMALVADRGERVSSAGFYFPADVGGAGGDPTGKPNLDLVETVAAVTGRFTAGSETDAPFGVAVVTRDLATDKSFKGESGTERLWRLEPRGAGGSSLGTPENPQLGEIPACDACVLVALKTDDDDIDELLMLSGGEALVFGVSDEGFALRTTFATTRTYRSITADSSPPQKYTPHPITEDLNGDGRSEVLLRATDGMLVLLWGRADGGLDEVALDDPKVACAGTETCAGAFFNADLDGDRELVVLTATGGFVFDVDVESRAFVTAGDLPGLDKPPLDPDFTAVRAGDFDGDGVDDLAILRTSSFLTVLRGVPEIE